MNLCKAVYINGDYQNGYEVGRKTNNVMPTKIEERKNDYESSMDREYSIWVDKELVVSISNVPVMVFYI